MRWRALSRCVADVRDVLDGRSDDDGAAPAWALARGWARGLAALSDEAVDAAERAGLAAWRADDEQLPGSLAKAAASVRALTALPVHEGVHPAPRDRRRASPRKQSQVAAFASLARPLASGCARVVDVGSGHGHLTRHLADALSLPAVGWELDEDRVAVARALAVNSDARFESVDVCAARQAMRGDDLVVGLHACGALGDAAVEGAREARAPFALVGCCYQKRGGDRVPLSDCGGDVDALTLPRAVLGLANMRDDDDGVEEDLAGRTRSRVHRIALRHVLRGFDATIAAGEEMRGVNRRRAVGDFEALVARAFEVRGWGAAPRSDDPRCIEALARAKAGWARARRFELARRMYARVVEVWIAHDRAMHLASQGRAVSVVEAFAVEDSPRNVAVLAARP